jgi:hypothetical protein
MSWTTRSIGETVSSPRRRSLASSDPNKARCPLSSALCPATHDGMTARADEGDGMQGFTAEADEISWNIQSFAACDDCHQICAIRFVPSDWCFVLHQAAAHANGALVAGCCLLLHFFFQLQGLVSCIRNTSAVLKAFCEIRYKIFTRRSMFRVWSVHRHVLGQECLLFNAINLPCLWCP